MASFINYISSKLTEARGDRDSIRLMWYPLAHSAGDLVLVLDKSFGVAHQFMWYTVLVLCSCRSRKQMVFRLLPSHSDVLWQWDRFGLS